MSFPNLGFKTNKHKGWLYKPMWAKSCTGVSGFCEPFFPSIHPLLFHVWNTRKLTSPFHIILFQKKPSSWPSLLSPALQSSYLPHKRANVNIYLTLYSLQITLIYITSFNPYKNPMKYYYLHFTNEKPNQNKAPDLRSCNLSKVTYSERPGIQVMRTVRNGPPSTCRFSSL